jgi:GT2 family glycosyltransferase
LPKPAPLASLIIPTRDKVEILRGCVESILEKTTYTPYEIIIVDNGSVENETLAYFEQLKARKNVRILRYDKPFNYSAINNFAVSKAKGSIIGLINNDIEVISPDWLTEMVSWAAQEDIGCVGAKLYYANNTIQHAGVILGIGGVANHAHLGLARHSPGYFGRAVVLSNYSAVTGACLVVRKSVFQQVGGLDAKNLAVAFNDVDFSLKVRNAGYLNVWTPYAELYHLESASRDKDESGKGRERFVREVNHMMRRWRDELVNDPYYSPSLTRIRGDFSLPNEP